MTERTRVPPTSTFVLRFWREWSDAEGRWRGRIEHVQSGRGVDFLDLEGALEFVQDQGVVVGSPTRSFLPEE